MNQPSLFAESERVATLRFRPEFEQWQQAARDALTRGLRPEDVWWQTDAAADPLAGGTSGFKVPAAFVELARPASCHNQADRWALLYSLLWRIVHGERHVLQLAGDPQVLRLNRYAKAVHRDMHKMKAFVRFREVESNGTARYVAWFEPSHFIVQAMGGFFRRRFANMVWSILTPFGCLHWEGSEAEGGLWFSEGVDRSAAPEGDRLEDAWRIYYRSIFNPARLKWKAMCSEMPQKYWKNLPEAQLIPRLVQEAEPRAAQMRRIQKREDRMRCGPRPETPKASLEQAAERAQDVLSRLALNAAACRNCALWEAATQTVFGEGPSDAGVMLIGEQPGDQEDLAGRPFVGPAGEVLDEALQAAGLERSRLYLTNAVKHFKYEPRGKRRLHKRPELQEVHACASWLAAEIEAVAPHTLVCLGATAARAVLGRPVSVQRERGRFVELERYRVLITVHPSYLLRLQDPALAGAEYQRLVSDLAQIA